MATRSLSPGGALLRASRLFSIPAPLPRPTAEQSTAGNNESDTATLPYPTHLTIATTPSSLSRGDWGLKRPLPLRTTTKTSTPLLRINSVDTIEHVTDFGSAADHTLTLNKWQEMNVPMVTPSLKGRPRWQPSPLSGRGVFNEDLGVPCGRNFAAADNDKRWNFRGPWLAGLTDGEFKAFFRKLTRSRKSQFQAFLREAKASEDTRTARQVVAEDGQETPKPVIPSDITVEELRLYMKELRRDREALFKLINSFLDLPPAPPERESWSQHDFGAPIKIYAKPRTISDSPYTETGPPKTHPSAGLSYLRSNRYIYNHPIYGPQRDPPPIQGRIIAPKKVQIGNFTPKLGIAGVVTDVPLSDSFNTSGSTGPKFGRKVLPGLLNLEPDKVGGSKVYLHPRTASIDSNGRIDLRVDMGEGPGLAILLGEEDKIQPKSTPPSRPIGLLQRSTSTTQQGNYGIESGDRSAERMTETGRWNDQDSTRDSMASNRSYPGGNTIKILHQMIEEKT